MEGDNHLWYVAGHRSHGSTNDVDERATNPSSGPEALEQIMSNFSNLANATGDAQPDESYLDAEDTEEIKQAKNNPPEPQEYTFSERDVMLYNLGIGAKANELRWTYENADGFEVSPTIHI